MKHHMFHSKMRLRLTLGLYLLVLVAVGTATGGYYTKRRLNLLATGYCPETGTILTEKQLTHSFMIDMIRQDARNQNVVAHVETSRSMLLGIIEGDKQIPFLDIVRAARYNHKSFAQNFSLSHVYDYRDDASKWVSSLSWPFTYVVINKHSFSRFIGTNHLSGYRNGKEKYKNKFGLIRQWKGYGNRFVEYTKVMLYTDCCQARSKYQTKEEYHKVKRRGYNMVLWSLGHGVLRHSRVVPVSNCGRLLIKSSKQYPGLHGFIYFNIKRKKQ